MIAGLRPRFLWGSPTDLPLDRDEVLRYLGFKPGKTVMTDRAAAAVDEGIARARKVIAPRAALVDCAVAAVGAEGLELASGLRWQSRRLARGWSGARAVTLIGATVGEGIETEVAALFQAQEYAVATAVDAAGSAFIHAWLREVHQQVAAGCAAAGMVLSAPYSPGYGDWDLADQHEMLRLVQADRIGLESTAACYLVPQKSAVAAVAWLHPNGQSAGPDGCAACAMRDCQYRKIPARAVLH